MDTSSNETLLQTKVTGNARVVPVQITKLYIGGGGWRYTYFNVGSRWMCAISFMLRPFYPTESTPVPNNIRLSERQRERQREYRRCQMRNEFMMGGKIRIMDLWVTQMCTEVG